MDAHEIPWFRGARAIRQQLVASARFSVQARRLQCVATILRQLLSRWHMVSFLSTSIDSTASKNPAAKGNIRVLAVVLHPRNARQIAIPESKK